MVGVGTNFRVAVDDELSDGYSFSCGSHPVYNALHYGASLFSRSLEAPSAVDQTSLMAWHLGDSRPATPISADAAILLFLMITA
jgi:hypothetical protein